ncbi:MAG TPA: ATP-binding protein [Chitinophagaceae bacterium]|nr:ATP-binding protein [Chitinophagaceae bacterium]
MSNMTDDNGISLSKKIPLTEDANFIKFQESRQKGEDFYVLEMSGERMKEHFRYLWKTIPEFDEAFRAMEKAGIPLPEKQVHHIANFSHGNLMFITLEPCPEAHDIFKRFALVFEQTYTRFLDLQKAEAMAKEAQVEVALERVRARAMAMQSSEELIEVADVMREQLGKLGQPELETSVVHLYPDEGDTFDSWYVLPAIASGQLIKGRAKIAKKGAILVEEMISKFKSKETEYTLEASGEKLTEWMGHMKKYLPDVYENSVLVDHPQKTFYRFSDFSGGSLIMVTFKEPSAEACNFQKRAAKVFDLAYQRFLDLKNAEAQARESQIQLALERVRARTMAMQRSEELPDAANLLFHQLQNLGMPAWSAGYCTWAEDKKSITLWMSSEGVLQPPFNAPLTEDPSFVHMLEAHEEGKALHIEAVGGEELVNHYKYMRTLPVVGEILDSIIEAGHPLPTFQIFHCAYFSKGFLLFITYEPIPQAHEIFKRFANVFEQTYTRFLDLKQAEQQAREAQIEVSLERVRARAMAMQNSDELRELIGTVFTELTRLDISLTRTLIMINDPETLDSIWWMANSEAPTQPMGFPVQYHEYPPYIAYMKAWKQKELKFLYVLEGQDKIGWDDFIFSETGLARLPDFVIAGMRAPDRVYLHASFNNFGNLTLASLNPLPDEHFDILLRFAKVFDLTYTRFNDLRIAEAQAREAKIEASLERVRSKAMAMHSSEDLAAAIKVFYHEIETLSITPRRCGVGLLDKETRTAELSTMNTTEEGNIVEVIGRIKMIDHPILEAVYDHWINQQEYHPVLRGNEINEYYKLLRPQISLPDYPHDAVQYGYFFFFPEGGVYAWTNQELPEDELQCYRRFTSVLSLTYKRYKDLKNAELQTHKAQIETALERVRARALAMQHPEELIDVSQVLRYEMGLLGVEELETSSIYLNDDTTGKTDCWYAIKDLRSADQKLVSDHFVLELKDTWVGREMLKFYLSSHKKTSIVMKGEARKEWIHYCEERSSVLKGYYGTEIPERTYHLYKFSQGAIGVASAGEISHESWDLLQRAASVFSLAYSRFKDLTNARLDLFRLKEEKQRAETALTELKSAQAQLIQAEKMASLGELTAGIAHEIQNPLNFVNNFSELSGELIREMEEELEKGNKQEAKTLAEDIQSNLEKINYHGKRADAIVKGMLLHSRTSRGDKEATDINALADEFLRLSYHGMRAKNHSFNADMYTSFDASIGKVQINSQDIGRVLLNLFNNAFYAVGEKKKKMNDDYEPLVTVNTRLSGNNIEIEVKDNGLGIPEKVKEKIFQPFFTTKPTGEGTGLGLSLSYDIITKGHGGSIKVDTIEQAGTTFTIQLPIENRT